MVSYREALADLLANELRTSISRLLTKGESPFARIKDACEVEHNETLTRSLRRLEDLGVVDHTYKHGSVQVFSFYGLTPFGRDLIEKLDGLESSAGKEWPSLKRSARKALKPSK